VLTFVLSQQTLSNQLNLSQGFIAIYLLVGAIFLFKKEIFHFNALTISFERLIISVFFLLIILEQNYSDKSLFKMQSFKFVSKFGQYTYGLYCLHMIGILIAATLFTKVRFNTELWQVLIVETLLALGITLILAYVSYHWYEKRFLILKNKFAFINTSREISDLRTNAKKIKSRKS
jgi:peptidoglycan/LPS O-acetylase OafA/YrhL